MCNVPTIGSKSVNAINSVITYCIVDLLIDIINYTAYGSIAIAIFSVTNTHAH